MKKSVLLGLMLLVVLTVSACNKEEGAMTDDKADGAATEGGAAMDTEKKN